MLQDLAFNLANNSSIATKSRAQAIGKIRTMRELLSSLKDTRFVVLNEQLVNSFIFIIRTTISHLTTGLQRGIDSLEAIDLNKIQLPTKTDISIEDFEKDLAQNDSLITTLEKLSSNVGLHWYNKAYRKFKHAVVAPAKAMALPAICTGAIATSAFFAWYYSDMENPKWLRDRVGWPAVISSEHIVNDPSLENLSVQRHLAEMAAHVLSYAEKDGFSREDIEKDLKKLLHLQAPKPVGWLGRMEARIHGLTTGRFVLGTMFMSGGLLTARAILPAISNWASKKIKSVDNFLMGGAYKNRTVDDFTYKSDVTFDSLIGQEDAKGVWSRIMSISQKPRII